MFKDSKDAWYPDIIQKAAELGLIAGYEDGTFRPKEPVTREQLIYFIMRYREQDIHQGTITSLVAWLKGSVVRVGNKRAGGGMSFGSGVVIDDKGTILTNKHVTDGHQELHVTFSSGADRPATFIRDSSGMEDSGAFVDLALIRATGLNSPTQPVKLADKNPEHGSFCLVMGAPLAFLRESATFGIVSHPKREHYIQVDAAINPGNSGGGCFDMRGRLVGVPTLKYVGAEIDNIAYLTGVEAVHKFLAIK